MKDIMRKLGIDAVYGMDAETYWASDYSLSNMATTEYVTDPRFKLHMMSVQKYGTKKAKVMNAKQFALWAKTINWARTGVLGHHQQFDGLIESFHFDIKPAFHFDTLSMARAVMPVNVSNSLDSLCKAFGLEGKKGADILVDTKGKRDLSKEEYKDMATYAGQDIEQTWLLFEKLLPYYTIDELRVIDITIKMYARPTVLLDKAGLDSVLASDQARKEELLKLVGVPKSHLTSKPKFAELLREAGVEPPTKVSVKKSEKAGYDVEDFAMSKQDQEFKDLLGHPIKRVRDLLTARFDVSSSSLESRCKLLAGRAHLGPQPVYLNYYGAKTGRWSGGDNANWQNLSSKRKEGGAELRASVMAPPGHMLIIADLAQIEARVNAWVSGQQDMIDVFSEYDIITGIDEHGEAIHKGADVYRVAASKIYGVSPDKIDKSQRFIGKTATLGLGYQCGVNRFAAMLRIGALGPPIEITDNQVRDIHTAWRNANRFIVANWKATQNKVASAFSGGQLIEDGCVSYEGCKKAGFIHLPNGMAIRYDDLHSDEEGLSYMSKYRRNKVAAPTIERTRLYGGIEVENICQGLARVVISEHMLALTDATKGKFRIAMSSHDEIVGVVPTAYATKALQITKEIMSTPPSWAKGLPIAVDAHISDRYDK